MLKLRVSKHVVCAWNWLLVYDPSHNSMTSGYTILLRKSHPGWEFARHLVSHIPEPLLEVIETMPWWEKLCERWSAEIAEIEVGSDTAYALYPPLVEMVNTMEGDDE